METLIISNTTGQKVTTSVIVAAKFHKSHKNVLQRITNLSCSQEFNRLNFEPTTYIDNQGREQPMYYITKDGFSFLVFGFNGKDAGEYKEKFLAAFNTVIALAVTQDANLNDYDFIMNRALAMSQIRMKNLEAQIHQKNEQIMISEKTVQELAPKAKYHDEVLQSKTGHPITLIAAELGMSAVRLNRILVKNGVIRKVGGTYVLCGKYLGRGFTDSYTHTHLAEDGVTKVTSILMTWTELGRKWLIEETRKYIMSPALN